MELPLGLFFLPHYFLVKPFFLLQVRSHTSDILTLWICHLSSNYGQVRELGIQVVHVFLSTSSFKGNSCQSWVRIGFYVNFEY